MCAKRKSRAKQHLLWHEINTQRKGALDPLAKLLRSKFVTLARTEARVLSLVAQQDTSAEIGKLLKIQEHSVENYRSKARRKMAMSTGVDLYVFLNRFIAQSMEG